MDSCKAMKRWSLRATALVLIVSATPRVNIMQGPACTGFTAPRTNAVLGVNWSFRVCTVEPQGSEIQLRFQNLNAGAAGFRLRLWHGSIQNCATRTRPAASRVVRLGPYETMRWPYIAAAAPPGGGTFSVCLDRA